MKRPVKDCTHPMYLIVVHPTEPVAVCWACARRVALAVGANGGYIQAYGETLELVLDDVMNPGETREMLRQMYEEATR